MDSLWDVRPPGGGSSMEERERPSSRDAGALPARLGRECPGAVPWVQQAIGARSSARVAELWHPLLLQSMLYGVINRIPRRGYSQVGSRAVAALPCHNSQAVEIGRAGSRQGIGAQRGAALNCWLLPGDGCTKVNTSQIEAGRQNAAPADDAAGAVQGRRAEGA